jgi:hypothetical protein
MKLVTKYQIPVINSCWEKCNYWWQKFYIWSQASYRYLISWETFFDPSDSYILFAEERGYHRWALAHSSSCLLLVRTLYGTKNEHICWMCIKINKVGKQEVGIWWVQKRFPRYRVPIWSLWPNNRSLPSIVVRPSLWFVTGQNAVCYDQVNDYTPSLRRGRGVYCFTSFRPSKIFFVTFFSLTVDGRNLIFGHKHHIVIPYCG